MTTIAKEVLLTIARDRVIAAALAYKADETYRDVSPPGPHDDASAELHGDMLDQALADYILALSDVVGHDKTVRVAAAEASLAKKPERDRLDAKIAPSSTANVWMSGG